jgi:regulator of protease activity HflC (stomatin/prohibitin superfamily)
MSTPIIALAVVALAVVMIYLLAGVRIVRPYQKGIVEILGRYRETVDPGLRLILPAFFKLRIVDMREQVVDVPPQEVITKDNVVVAVDAVVYYEPTDPQRLVYNVADFMMAITKLAQTNLRNLIGDMDLDSALTSRDQINTTLRNILDEATDKWGVRVGRVEIQRIDPPVDVMNAMHEQMKAERTRRAVVTQADGQREAALEAQGEADAIRAVADAESFRLRTVADGEADAVTSVYGAIKAAAPNNELIAIKYIEALRFIADGRATKIFLPTETAGVMGSIAGIAELFASSVDHHDSRHAGADPVSASGDGSVRTGAEIVEPGPS